MPTASVPDRHRACSPRANAAAAARTAIPAAPAGGAGPATRRSGAGSVHATAPAGAPARCGHAGVTRNIGTTVSATLASSGKTQPMLAEQHVQAQHARAAAAPLARVSTSNSTMPSTMVSASPATAQRRPAVLASTAGLRHRRANSQPVNASSVAPSTIPAACSNDGRVQPQAGREQRCSGLQRSPHQPARQDRATRARTGQHGADLHERAEHDVAGEAEHQQVRDRQRRRVVTARQHLRRMPGQQHHGEQQPPWRRAKEPQRDRDRQAEVRIDHRARCA